MCLNHRIVVRSQRAATVGAKRFEFLEVDVSVGGMAITMIPFRASLRTSDSEYVVWKMGREYILADAQQREVQLATARLGSFFRGRTYYGRTSDSTFQFGPSWLLGSKLSLHVDDVLRGTFAVRSVLRSLAVEIEFADAVQESLVGYFCALSLYDAWRNSTG
jgi:hypothetical protein